MTTSSMLYESETLRFTRGWLLTRQLAVAVVAATALLGLAGCGHAEGTVKTAAASQPEKTGLTGADCPGAVMSKGEGGRVPGAKGAATAEEAAEPIRADVDKTKTKKLKKTGKRVDTGDPKKVRLLYENSDGKVVAQIDVVQDDSGWWVDQYLGCGQEATS